MLPMLPRGFLLTAIAALLSCTLSLAQQEGYVRPNEDEECGTSIDFLAYAEGLENTMCEEEQCEYQEKTGTLFDLKYRGGYKIVEYKTSSENEGEIVEVGGQPTLSTATTYILYPCGVEEPNDQWIQDRKEANTSALHFVEIPLTAVATDESTAGWMLEELGVLERVRYGSEFGTTPCMQKIADSEAEGGCGRKFNSSFSPMPTNSAEFDAEISFTGDVENKQIYFQASADPGPLARAEHIVYLSAFFNLEANATDWYKQVSDSYSQKTGSVEAGEAPPTVAWITVTANGSESFQFGPDGITPLDGPVVVLSFARYKAILTRDAGGSMQVQADVANTTNAFASNDDIKLAAAEFPTQAAFLEAVATVLTGVDVLIDESFLEDPAENYTVDGVLGILGLNGTDVAPASYPFIGNENIWRHDKARSADGHDDWFGEAIARPDLVHSDLVEILTPGSVENHTFKFFRNLSKGENVVVTGPDDCTLPCEAYEEQVALVVGDGSTAGTEAEGPEGTDGTEDVTERDSSPAARSTFAAGVVIATTMLAAMI